MDRKIYRKKLIPANYDILRLSKWFLGFHDIHEILDSKLFAGILRLSLRDSFM